MSIFSLDDESVDVPTGGEVDVASASEGLVMGSVGPQSPHSRVAPAKRRPERSSRAARPDFTNHMVLKAIEKYEFVKLLPGETLERVAAVTGSKHADPARLTAHVLSTGGKSAVATHLQTLLKAREQSELDVMVVAVGLDRSELNGVWRLLTVLGAAEGVLPGKEITAAKQLTQAVVGLTEQQLRGVEEVTELVVG